MPAAEKEDPLDSGAIIVAEYHGKAGPALKAPQPTRRLLRKQSEGYVCARPRLGDGPKVGGCREEGNYCEIFEDTQKVSSRTEDTREWATKSIFLTRIRLAAPLLRRGRFNNFFILDKPFYNIFLSR